MLTPQSTPELARYLDLKLAALGQPTARTGTGNLLLETAGPLLRSYYQKDRLLGQYLCPADMRIQSFPECGSGFIPAGSDEDAILPERRSKQGRLPKLYFRWHFGRHE